MCNCVTLFDSMIKELKIKKIIDWKSWIGFKLHLCKWAVGLNSIKKNLIAHNFKNRLEKIKNRFKNLDRLFFLS